MSADTQQTKTTTTPTQLSALPLQYVWDFYHVDPRQVAKGIWDPELFSTIFTVSDFWTILNHLVSPSYLPHNAFLYLFKQGIAPKWESPENAQGGELTLTLDPKQLDPDVIDDVWDHTLLALIDSALIKSLTQEWADNLNIQQGEIRFKPFNH